MTNAKFFKAMQRRSKQLMPEGTKVVLFGSQARGDAYEESDWDILILMDKQRISRADFDEYAYPLVELGWKNNEQVSPLLYTYADWQKRKHTSLYHNIEMDGIEL